MTMVTRPPWPASEVTLHEEEGFSPSPELVILTDPEGPRAEAVRQLRTRLRLGQAGQGGRSLTLIGAVDDSGCSFVAANLAVAIAQTGAQVALIDADLRASNLADVFGISDDEGGGLTNYLERNDESPEPFQQLPGIDSLSLIWAGGSTSHGQELLATERFRQLLQSCLRTFDVTIIDTAPAVRYADAQYLASLSGQCLLVGRRNHTAFEDMARINRQLTADGIKVVGSVLNLD